MALSARCATGHLSQRERQGVCTVSRLPLLRAKCRALPGCALYARLRADVMRELARRKARLRERLPLRHGFAVPRQIVNQVQHFLLKFLLEFSNQDTSWDGY